MPMTMKKTYTADEFYALGLTEPCELINGEIVSMSPSPNIRHQRISMRIVNHISNYISKNKGKCEVFCSPTDVEQPKRNIEKHNRTSRNILNKYTHNHIVFHFETPLLRYLSKQAHGSLFHVPVSLYDIRLTHYDFILY